MTDKLILATDQGTTSTRAIIFNADAQPVSVAQQEFTQYFPADGWVEHDAEEIWTTTLRVCQEALTKAQSLGQVISIGITNQRETVVIWDRATAQPIARAIVWQDRRTADTCTRLKEAGHEEQVTALTGLLLDPYFSATKIGWMLDHVDGARERAERGELCFGTTDSWLIYKLTGGKTHCTDATNASRTLLFDIHNQKWDASLCQLFGVPQALLPEVKDCAADFGQTDAAVFGVSLPIGGVAGDQQSALVGQACLQPGMVKSTYGTGCFMLMNTGAQAVTSRNKLLTTVGYRLNGETTYALEGAIFNAGTAIQWLRDGLEIIESAAESAELASRLDGNEGVYLVPAFTGMGAPWWDPHARGSLLGITRDTQRAHLVRAALESVCYQTRDLVQAMLSDSDAPLATLRVDGGMVVNDWLMQFMADVLDAPIDRPTTNETTVLGAAFLAGLQAGLFPSVDAISDRWSRDRRFESQLADDQRQRLLQGWSNAVQRTVTVT